MNRRMRSSFGKALKICHGFGDTEIAICGKARSIQKCEKWKAVQRDFLSVVLDVLHLKC